MTKTTSCQGSLAKRLGCKRVVALINRRAYAEMIEGGPIDIGISPAQVSIGTLLAHVRQGDVAEVHSLRRGRSGSAGTGRPRRCQKHPR
jgi:trk system potassium uptake protein TrkA